MVLTAGLLAVLYVVGTQKNHLFEHSRHMFIQMDVKLQKIFIIYAQKFANTDGHMSASTLRGECMKQGYRV